MTEAPEWHTLQHAQGPATRVPATLKKLLGKQEQARVDAFDTLRGTLVGHNRWFGASAPAVHGLLADLEKAPEPDLLLILVADILGADHVRGWLLPPDSPTAPESQPAVDAVLSHAATLTGQLRSKNPRARAAVPVLMAMVPSHAKEWLPLLVERIETDQDAEVRASALLALAKLEPDDGPVLEAIATMRTSISPLLRGTAALAQLRRDASCDFSANARGILEWLSAQPSARERKAWLPWFGGLEVAWYAMHQKLDGSAHALFALAKAREREAALVDTCLQLGTGEPMGREARRLGALILEGSGLSARPEAAVHLFEELSENERRVASRLATTTLVPKAGRGMPSAGASRRRWAGLERPGPLEQPVDVELDGQARRVPFWFALRELAARKVERAEKGKGPFPAPIAEAVAGAERWQAVAELLCMNYATNCILVDRFDDELATIELDDEVLTVAASVAEDLVTRVHAAMRDESPAITSALASAWVLLPFVRTGRPIDERWDVLVEVGKDERDLEIFRALPPNRREARLLGYLGAEWKVMHLVSVFERALTFLPLAPTVSVVRALLDLVARHACQPRSRAAELRSKLETLAADDDRVRAAVVELAQK